MSTADAARPLAQEPLTAIESALAANVVVIKLRNRDQRTLISIRCVFAPSGHADVSALYWILRHTDEHWRRELYSYSRGRYLRGSPTSPPHELVVYRVLKPRPAGDALFLGGPWGMYPGASLEDASQH